jgi:predicted ABC-type ATPase
MMKVYTVIAGTDGVGKSSMMGILKTQRNDLGVIINPDEIAANNGRNEMKAGKTALKLIAGHFADGISFTQETTLSGFLIKKNFKTAKENGYFIRLIYIGIGTCAESKKRIKRRAKKGGHFINDTDVERRFNKRFADLFAVLPLCDEAFFYDNENGFAEVGEYRDGRIVRKGTYLPKWFAEIS